MPAPPAPRVSVVIPTYQRWERVIEAVASVFEQTVAAHEVIVVDDGSTDGTAEALATRFGETVLVRRQENRGPSAARNAGVAASTGDLLCFLDSDNRWYPHHLETILALEHRCPDAVVVGTQRGYRWGDQTPSDVYEADVALPLVLGRAGVGLTSSVAIRRDAFLTVGGFDESMRYGEDVDLLLRLALVGPVGLISARTFHHATSTDSLSVSGNAAGAFFPMLVQTAEHVTVALDTVARPDAEALRRAARARAGLGRALGALDREESPAAIRAGLAEAFDALPSLGNGAGWVLRIWGPGIRGWDDPATRLDRLDALVGAWPATGEPARAQVHATALRLALGLHRPDSVARHVRGLVSPAGWRRARRAVGRRVRRPRASR